MTWPGRVNDFNIQQGAFFGTRGFGQAFAFMELHAGQGFRALIPATAHNRLELIVYFVPGRLEIYSYHLLV